MAKTRVRKYKRGGTHKTAKWVNDYKFEIEVEDYINKILRMIIWMPNNYPCILVLIDKSNNTASIESVQYNQFCKRNGTMAKRGGTTEMINFIFSKLKEIGVTKVSLTDKSEIICEPSNTKIKLYIHNFVLYGMTWYERVFGFKIEDKHTERYANSKALRESNLAEVNRIKDLYKNDCTYFTPERIDEYIVKFKLDFLRGSTWVKHL